MSELMLDVGQANELKLAFRRNDWTNDDIKWLCEGNVLTEVLQMRRGRAPLAVSEGDNHFPLTITHTQTLLQMIDACNFSWVDSDIIPKRFLVNGEGKQEIITELVHFGRGMSSDAVIAELNHRGLRPAVIAELLAFGATYPEEQCKFPIIALGSVAKVGGTRGVPCLCGDGAERHLYLAWYRDGWSGHFRFLAVRN